MGLSKVGKIDFSRIREELAPAHAGWTNCTIEIIDPDIRGTNFDRVANTKQRTYEVKWTGNARIMAMRWPNVATTRQEAVSVRTVVFHCDRDADNPMPLYVPEGWRIRVIDGDITPEFLTGLFVITSSINSSYDWDHRIETMMDQGASIEWA